MADPSNPFAPASGTGPAPTAGEPLYSETASLVTTFFATPLGAAVLLGVNASRTGQNPFAVVGACAAVFVGVLIVAMVPLPIPGFVFTLLQVLAIQQVWRAWFSEPWATNLADGVEPAPWWHAALLCVGGVLLQVAIAGLFIWLIGLDELANL